ncbi:MAG: carboxypeptidase regulatory-like domain-containing protein [Janthinobacterium lividum]
MATAPYAADALPTVAAPKLVCLAGVVLGPNGQPCPGACVFATTNTHQMTVTDADGNFQLQVPVQSALTVQADFMGQGSSQVAIDSHMPLPVRLVLAR